MKKHVFGRQFKRDANERKALFKNLLTSLVLEERIETTEAKAKAIRAAADKLITSAKKGGASAYQNLDPRINHNAVVKIVSDIAPRFVGRNGGYTRMFRTHKRVADNAQMVIMEWVEKGSKLAVQLERSPAEKKTKREAKPKTEKKEETVTVAKKAEGKEAGKKETKKKSKAK